MIAPKSSAKFEIQNDTNEEEQDGDDRSCYDALLVHPRRRDELSERAQETEDETRSPLNPPSNHFPQCSTCPINRLISGLQLHNHA